MPASVRQQIVNLLKQGYAVETITERTGASVYAVQKIRASERILTRARGDKRATKHYRELVQLRALTPLLEHGWSLPTEAERRAFFLKLSRAGNRASA